MINASFRPQNFGTCMEPILQDNKTGLWFSQSSTVIFGIGTRNKASFWTAEKSICTKTLWTGKSSATTSVTSSSTFWPSSASDGIVNENLAENFVNEVQYSEAKFFYGFQIMMENIHSEMYSLLIDTLVDNDAEKDELFNAIERFPAIKKRQIGRCVGLSLDIRRVWLLSQR